MRVLILVRLCSESAANNRHITPGAGRCYIARHLANGYAWANENCGVVDRRGRGSMLKASASTAMDFPSNSVDKINR